MGPCAIKARTRDRRKTATSPAQVCAIYRWAGHIARASDATTSMIIAGDKPQNNDSMVLSLSYKQSSLLLAGNAEKEWNTVFPEHPRASLLRVGHPDSANATTPELPNSARPEFAISVGSGDSFGLPRNETLARLAAAGTRVYRTDLDAAVTFYLDGRSVTPALTGLQ